MKISEVIERIIAYHPEMPEYGSHPERECDGFKCGDPEQECTGILTSVAAPVKVIRRAIELGYNLIVVHEPVFYTHLDPTDWLEGNEVYEEKIKLINEHNIVIWRDHDHIHRHQPDGIFYGVAKELGWEEYASDDNKYRDFVLPPTPAREIALHLKEKMNLNAVRIIGNPDAVISRLSWPGMHIMDDPNNDNQKKSTQRFIDVNADAMLTMECIDWTLASYVRDAGQLGMPKILFMVGHMNSEELGMKWAVNWISELVEGKLPVEFYPSGDMYDYIF